MQHGYRAPGCGVIISALENGLKKPGSDELICEKVVTGKPNPLAIDLIRGQHGIPESDLKKMIMFGDRPNTDIQLANNAGIDSCLVLSGVTRNEEEALEWIAQDPKNQPTYVMPQFGDDINGNPELALPTE